MTNTGSKSWTLEWTRHVLKSV